MRAANVVKQFQGTFEALTPARVLCINAKDFIKVLDLKTQIFMVMKHYGRNYHMRIIVAVPSAQLMNETRRPCTSAGALTIAEGIQPYW